MTSKSSCPVTGSTGKSHSNPSEDEGRGREQKTQYQCLTWKCPQSSSSAIPSFLKGELRPGE